MNYEQEAMKTLDIRIHEWKGMPPAGANGHSIGSIDFSLDYIKTRARELGWVNGYEWGVEYPTNGKKPDLPDDLVIEVDSHNVDYWLKGRRVKSNDWAKTNFFRIVDERYKPVEVEQVQADWYNYDKQQAIALPPVGAKIEFNYQSELTWEVSHVVAIHHFRKDLILAPFDSSGKLIYANELSRMRPLDYNRKADEERRAFVEAGFETIGEYFNLGDALRRLYNAGCRFK